MQTGTAGKLMNTLLTHLFTDIENSTPLWEQFPSEMREASARHDRLMREVIESHHGRVVKTTGDGFHGVFKTPTEGVAAALAGQQVILAENWPAAMGPLKVRMGLNTGESQARAEDYYGSSVNLAARIMSLGYGGQVLISGITADLVKKTLPQDCTLADLGEHRLKGIAAPEQIYQLCHPALRPEFPHLKSLTTYKHNLPPQLSSFIGRHKELADVKRMLQGTRLLTLLGPGGTGKTRLMLQAAEEIIEAYPDGVWLVELASLTDPGLIPERIAAALNIQEQPGRQMLDTLSEYLRRKETLLLIDNVEHLVRESAVAAEHLLRKCPNLKILVTGREALFIEGESTLQIPSLSLPEGSQIPEEIAKSEGVQLFSERARTVRPDFALTQENAGTIAEIVQRLDGIPLALELAAARLRMMTAEQIAARLNDRFRLLTGGRRTALPRQQTLQALIDWSWNLLDEVERVLLRRLSVFSGGWTLEAAQTVAGFNPLDEFDVLEALEQLINKSLVNVRFPPEGEARYGMLESIRQYAQNRLIESGEGETLRGRHVDHFVSLVKAFDEDSMGPDFFSWMKRFDLEEDNLRAVMNWIAEDHPKLLLQFTGMLIQFRMDFLHYREARSWLEAVIGQTRKMLEQDPAAVNMKDFIRALRALGWLDVTHGEMASGHSLLDECIQLARQHGEFRSLAFALGMKAQAMGTTVTQEVIEQIEQIIATSRQNHLDTELIMTLFSAGQAYVVRGNLEKGKAYLDEVIQMSEKYDVPFMKAWVYYPRALMARASKNMVEAEKYFLLAVEGTEKWGDQRLIATARSELAHLYRQVSRLDEAVALYRQTIPSWQEQGHLSAVAHQLECFAFIAIARDQHLHAAQMLGAAKTARARLNALSTEPDEIAELERAMEQLAGALGEKERDQAIAEGGRMDLDEAVYCALEAAVPTAEEETTERAA
jgi:predicted ATPase/class 3 adenylate cyclase